MESIIKPKRPIVDGWLQGPPLPTFVSQGYESESWVNTQKGLCVISAVEPCRANVLEYHLSVSKGGYARCSNEDVVQVLEQFGMIGAEEDNPVFGGRARNFWLPTHCTKSMQ